MPQTMPPDREVGGAAPGGPGVSYFDLTRLHRFLNYV